ncbi:MAG: hypothetical protein ACPG45_10500 [Flavobacteriaceae bacterium]|jgi:hypothetical protein
MTNDIKSLENKFVNNMGSGVAAGANLFELVRTTINSEDARPLASAIARLLNKGDTQGVTAVKAIVGAVFVGAKLKKAKDKKTLILDISKADVDNFAYSRFAAAIHPDRKLSLRSTLVKEVLNKKKPSKVELPKSAEAFVKRMNKEGFTKAAVIAAIQGL